MDREFFRTNRQRLIAAHPQSVVVLTAYTQQQRSGDAAHHFEQEANFWWLTGIEQPDWWLIIDSAQGMSWLVAPTVDEVHAIFDGDLLPDQAQDMSGVDKVISRTEAEAKLREYAAKGRSLATLGKDPSAAHYNFVENPAGRRLRAFIKRAVGAYVDVRPALASLRAIKQPVELAAMQSAIDVTVEAFEHVAAHLKEFSYEYEIEAEFSYYFRRHGATGHAYDPIVASAGNACTLHYDTNNAALPAQGFVLLDIGARRVGYAADITRTYALGDPSPRQRAVHAAVREAQAAIIELIQPGRSVRDYLEASDALMRRALKQVGFDTESDPMLFRRYFPHAISHGLGVDVHDNLGAPEVFQPGMVLTVEPGIYIPEEAIGVRIEDDILVTAHGHQNLSRALSTDC